MNGIILDRSKQKGYLFGRLNEKPERLKEVQGNIKKAIDLLNDGYSYEAVGLIMGCGDSSVIYLQKREEKKGIVFKKFKHRKHLEDAHPLSSVNRKKRREEEKLQKIKIEFEEPLNEGQDYADYLKKHQEETKKDIEALKERARATIAKIKKDRKKSGMTRFVFLDVI